jgi:predicted NBD/HSP70 family sugar kinase
MVGTIAGDLGGPGQGCCRPVTGPRVRSFMSPTRQASIDTIFHLLRELPETTRTDLVARTGLSKGTISETVAELIANGLVAETGKRRPERGRRQVLLRLCARSRLVIGAEFNEHGCQAVLADLRAGPIRFAKRVFVSTVPENFVAALAECVTELRSDTSVPILGIGIGVPGLVDDAGRTVAVSVPFAWRDVPIADLVEERTGLSTTIANRAKAAALGEYWQGSPQDLADRSHLVYITAGAGIVAGFVVNGDPWYGHVGTAGELGHTTVEPDGPQCGCGNRGCLHMLASESAIIRDVRQRYASTPDNARAYQPALDLGDDATIDELAVALHDGHPLVIQAIEQAARYLGIAIGNLINIVNPSHVVIGGSVATFGDVLLVPLRAEIQRRSLWDAYKRLSIATSTLGDAVGPIGGAALCLSRVDSSRVIHTP